MKSYLLVALLTVDGIQAHAADYYVTQPGAGSQNGTNLANAWSLANFNATTNPTAGDTVHFSGTFTGQVELRDNGSNANLLTFDFSLATISDLGSNRIQFNSNSYINLLGGAFASDTNGEIDALLDFQDRVCSNVFIANWSFNGNSNGGTVFATGLNNMESFLTFSNNCVTNIANFLYGSSQGFHDITVINNWIQQNMNTNQQSDLLDFADGHNYLIQGNFLDLRAPGNQTSPPFNERHNDPIQTWTSGGGYGPGVPYGLTIRYNWIQQDIGVGIGGTNSSLSVSDGSTSWGMMEQLGSSNGVDAVDYYGNVFVGTSQSGFGNNGIAFDNCQSYAVVRLYNNTIIVHGNPGNCVRFLAPGTLYAENNAMEADPGFFGNMLTWTFAIGKSDYNYYYNFQNPGSTYTGPHGASNVNLLFNNYKGGDYGLSASSPCRGAGDSSIGSIYSQGLSPGATWPNPALVVRSTGAWDIGAYVYAAAITNQVNNNPTNSVSPAALNFSLVQAGATSNLDLRVENTGGGTLAGTASVAAPFSIASGASYSLSAGQSQTVVLAYSPTTAGTNSQTVTFTGGNGVAATVTGFAIAPPVVSAITQNGADIDATDPGLQIYAESVIQYSASVTDPNGFPLAWQWSYTINGGTPTVVESGTGAVAGVSFNYTAATVAAIYVWTLQVSNAYLSASSGLTVGVEAPPPATPSLTFQATNATITAPFVLTSDYILQAEQITVPTNSGKAVFSFTISNAGQYIIEALVNAASDANNSFYVNIDAMPVDPMMIWDTPTTSGFEERFVSWRGNGTEEDNQFVPEIFNLSAGAHQLIICGREPDTELQSVSIVEYPTPPSNLVVGTVTK